MDITYLGHACFKLRSTNANVITDPYNKDIGFAMPRVSADVVTVSHDHSDHNNIKVVTGTARRERPFIIDAPGEYEVGGISVFGVGCFHDDQQGKERGRNVAYSILIDAVSVVHLGDLGHTLSESQLEELNGADVLLCPIGGHFTLDPKLVSQVVAAIEPTYLVPMHYKTSEHAAMFEPLISVDEFMKINGWEYKQADKLTINKNAMPEEMEVVVLQKTA